MLSRKHYGSSLMALEIKTKNSILACYKPPYDKAIVEIDFENPLPEVVVSKAQCSVLEDHYIQPTGHLNAVTWQIVLNQIAYLSFGYLCQIRQLKMGGEDITVERFIELRDHTLIRRTEMTFLGLVSPQRFVTQAKLKRMRGVFWEMKASILSDDQAVVAEATMVLTLDPRYRT